MKTKYYQSTFDTPKTLSNSNLQKIIQFYLIECPVEGCSNRGQTFTAYGFIGAKSFSKLKRDLIATATPSLEKNYYPCNKSDLTTKFSICEKIEYPDEYCVFLKNDEKSVIRSMFSAIRNAFAHGSFNVKTYNKQRIYYFSNYKNYEKARIVLHEETLLNWIKIIKRNFKYIK